MSQLNLACEAEVSQKHLSFVESDAPSRAATWLSGCRKRSEIAIEAFFPADEVTRQLLQRAAGGPKPVTP